MPFWSTLGAFGHILVVQTGVDFSDTDGVVTGRPGIDAFGGVRVDPVEEGGTLPATPDPPIVSTQTPGSFRSPPQGPPKIDPKFNITFTSMLNRFLTSK